MDLELFHLSLAIALCSIPNPFQWIAILSLIAGAGVFTVSSGVSIATIGVTIVTMLMAGASFEAISTTIGSHIAIATGSLHLLTEMIAGIASILGC